MTLETSYYRGLEALHLEAHQVPSWEQLVVYKDELLKWNQKMNLTTITDPDAILERHFLDSLAILPYLPSAGRLMDVGCGPGFPGLMIKLARPDLEVVLIEAREKKVHFLNHVIRQLGFSVGIQTQALFLDPKSPYSELGRFDGIVTRAALHPEAFLALCAPYEQEHTQKIMMRGSLEENLPEPHPRKIMAYCLPFSQASRSLLIW
jgi:16S rRNA (guanine527-N7)-methyltransferase